MADDKIKESEKVATPSVAVESKKKKGMSKLVKVFIIVAIAIVGLVVSGFLLFSSVTSGATTASDEFLNALQAGDATTAYNLFSTEAQAVVIEEDFIIAVNQIGPILNTEESKESINIAAETGSNTTGSVVYEIEGTDDKTYTVVIDVVKEDGVWKVHNFDSEVKE